MKRLLILTLLVSTGILTAKAQSNCTYKSNAQIQNFGMLFRACEGKSYFETFEISGQMVSMMLGSKATISAETNIAKAGLDPKNTSGISYIRIININHHCKGFFQDAYNIINKNDYKLLTSMAQDGQKIACYCIPIISLDGRNTGLLSELVLIREGNKENSIVIIGGKIDIKNIRSIPGVETNTGTGGSR